MNKIVLFLAFLVINCSINANEISLKESEFVRKIAQTVEHLHEQKGIVWKSYDLSDSPLIITFSNQHIYAFGLKSDHPAWEVKHIDHISVLYSQEDHWGITNISMQDKFVVDGQETFVFHIDENSPNQFEDRPLLVLVHELFHRYQFGHFKPISYSGAYLDQYNIENLSLIQLEERVLIDFLKAKAQDKLERLKDFVAIHQTRIQMIDPLSIRWEEVQQMMEGLADYSSIQTFASFPILPRFDVNKYLQSTLAGYVYSQDPQELAVKWRHYGVGATLGVALDYLNVTDWKEQIEQGETSQVALIEKAIKLSDVERNSRLDRIKNEYHYHEIFQDLTQKVENHKTKLGRLMNDYINQEGAVITLNRPRDITINGGGTSYGIFHLDEGITVSVNDTSFSSTTDDLWKLKVDEIPFLFQNGAGERILKVDHDLVLFLDDQPYSIDELKRQTDPIPFQTIAWSCKTSTFESHSRSGTIHGLSIMFD